MKNEMIEEFTNSEIYDFKPKLSQTTHDIIFEKSKISDSIMN